MTTNELNLDQAAELLGYERIQWATTDDGTACYVGYGSSNPTDRSKDAPEGYYVAGSDAELAKLIEHAR